MFIKLPGPVHLSGCIMCAILIGGGGGRGGPHWRFNQRLQVSYHRNSSYFTVLSVLRGSLSLTHILNLHIHKVCCERMYKDTSKFIKKNVLFM